MSSIFDFLFGKRDKIQRPTDTKQKSSTNTTRYQKQESNIVKNTNVIHEEKTPLPKEEVKITPSAIQSHNRFEIGKIKVTDQWSICSNLESSGIVGEEKIVEVYCPMRPAIIYCHSILIDKLGDMTKFIISSLYHEVSIDDICTLTDMGEKTISEEVAYLVNGGLIDNETKALTSLGREYGELLDRFKRLSDGIPVYLNTYCNEFVELEDEEQLTAVLSGIEECVLPEDFEYIYTRNDNYANSMKIASGYIQPEVPFSFEIKRSLYTTVNVVQGKKEVRYRKLVIKDIDTKLSRYRGTYGIPVLVPYRKLVFKPRYTVLNKYRRFAGEIHTLYLELPELFQDDIKTMIPLFDDEAKADSIEVFLDLSSGDIHRNIEIVKDKIPDEIQIILEDKPVEIRVNDSLEKQITLEILSQDDVYGIQYFPFRSLEVPDEKD